MQHHPHTSTPPKHYKEVLSTFIATHGDHIRDGVLTYRDIRIDLSNLEEDIHPMQALEREIKGLAPLRDALRAQGISDEDTLLQKITQHAVTNEKTEAKNSVKEMQESVQKLVNVNGFGAEEARTLQTDITALLASYQHHTSVAYQGFDDYVASLRKPGHGR